MEDPILQRLEHHGCDCKKNAEGNETIYLLENAYVLRVMVSWVDYCCSLAGYLVGQKTGKDEHHHDHIDLQVASAHASGWYMLQTRAFQ